MAQQAKQQQPAAGTRHPAVTAARTGLMLAAVLACMLVPSGDWSWPAAWFVVAAAVGLCLLPSWLYLLQHNPTLIPERERYTRNEGTAGFDRIILPILAVSTIGRYIAAGLQHRVMLQAGIPTAGLLSSPAMVAACAALAGALALQTWAVTSNHFFSSVVRLQADRGHRVCSSGPYAVVRHPGYVAFSVQGIAEAVLLQSSWCMALALVKVAALVVRTYAEDAFLHRNLPGYAAFAQRTTRYRLVPGVW